MKHRTHISRRTSGEKGFTLIELLVVIAIIGILSSVILASLMSASLRGRDASVRSEVNQLRITLSQEYTDTGSFKNLQPVAAPCAGGLTCTDGSWLSTVADCSTWGTASNASTYEVQAEAICENIMKNTGASYMGANGAASLWIGSLGSDHTKYSIMAWLPYKQAFYCVGSSNGNSDYTTSGTTWLNPGCYNNP